jgi:ATP-dependent RNA helicase DeaD
MAADPIQPDEQLQQFKTQISSTLAAGGLAEFERLVTAIQAESGASALAVAAALAKICHDTPAVPPAAAAAESRVPEWVERKRNPPGHRGQRRQAAADSDDRASAREDRTEHRGRKRDSDRSSERRVEHRGGGSRREYSDRDERSEERRGGDRRNRDEERRGSDLYAERRSRDRNDRGEDRRSGNRRDSRDRGEQRDRRDHDRSDRGDRRDRGEQRGRRQQDDGVEREQFRVEVGHEHGVQPGNIVGAIAKEAGLDSKYIGRIKILDRCSYVDLPKDMPPELMRVLRNLRVGGQRLQIAPAGERPRQDRERPRYNRERPRHDRRQTRSHGGGGRHQRRDRD